MRKRTRDLLFTLFGDYLRQRGGEVWIGSLVQLLGCLGASAQAVHAATARLARKGWLARRRAGRHSFYAITPKMAALLAEGGERIYHPLRSTGALCPWDGYWYLVIYSFGETQRRQRNRLRKQLVWLGCGQLSSGTWITPHDLYREVPRVVKELALSEHVSYFRVRSHGVSDDAALVARCWDLTALNDAYRRFLASFRSEFEAARQAEINGQGLSPRECFVQRFWLVHKFRGFPYKDPHLPPHLLPADWQGKAAIELFSAYQELLTDRACAFVDGVLAEAPSKG